MQSRLKSDWYVSAICFGVSILGLCGAGWVLGDDAGRPVAAPRVKHKARAKLSHVAAPSVEPAGALPDCDQVSTWDEGDVKDCRRTSADHVGLRFEGRTTKVAPHQGTGRGELSYQVTVKVFAPSGALLQTITEDAYKPYGNQYFLHDLDEDGRDELIIMTDGGGTGGVSMAVWRAIGDETMFQRAGTMFGFMNFWKTQDGFFALYAHDSAASGVVTMYRFEGHVMKEVAALAMAVAPDTNQRDEHGEPKAVGTRCQLEKGALLDGGDWRTALMAAHIDPTTAERHFCSEPWAKNYYHS